MSDESTTSAADDFVTTRDIRATGSAKGTRASSADELSREADDATSKGCPIVRPGPLNGSPELKKQACEADPNCACNDQFCDYCNPKGSPPPPAVSGAAASLERSYCGFKGGWNDMVHKGAVSAFGDCESKCDGYDYFGVSCGGSMIKCHCITATHLSAAFVGNGTRTMGCDDPSPDAHRANCAIDRDFTDSAGDACKAALSPTVRAFFRKP